MTAVPAARAAARHKLLAPEGHTAVSAVPGLYGNYYFIDKHNTGVANRACKKLSFVRRRL
jgi:hypothetical protein